MDERKRRTYVFLFVARNRCRDFYQLRSHYLSISSMKNEQGFHRKIENVFFE